MNGIKDIRIALHYINLKKKKKRTERCCSLANLFQLKRETETVLKFKRLSTVDAASAAAARFTLKFARGFAFLDVPKKLPHSVIIIYIFTAWPFAQNFEESGIF